HRVRAQLSQRKKRGEMGGVLMQHHQISRTPLRKAAFAGSFALQRGDYETL
uniref:Uncharacterized protein n=1 Tax=Aegilops tauschii subsp. strangulata TaxID=200361 RepID=A0A453ECM1_AEGTS